MSGEDKADTFHERAARSASEARNLAITLSSGGLAGLFALVTRYKVPLDVTARWFLAVSGALFTLAIGFGILNSFADARWSFLRAQLIAKSDRKFVPPEQKWYRLKRQSEIATQAAFFFAVVCAAILLARKIFEQ